MMTLLPMGVGHLQVKTLVLYFSNCPALHGVTTFFDVLFETSCIILHLKIYIFFLQLIH